MCRKYRITNTARKLLLRGPLARLPPTCSPHPRTTSLTLSRAEQDRPVIRTWRSPTEAHVHRDRSQKPGSRRTQGGRGKRNGGRHFPTQFNTVQSLSRVRLSAIPGTAARKASLSTTNSWSLLKPIFIKSVMPSNHLILCHPLLSPSMFPSIRVFTNESALRIRWPKYWSFSFSMSLSNEYSGLISFRMDWLDLLAVGGTLKSLPQHHSLKASILRRSGFFIVQLSHPYMTAGKTIANVYMV